MEKAIKKEAVARPAKITATAAGETTAKEVSFIADFNTSGSSSHAEHLFDSIGYGKGRAVKINNRDNNSILARELRTLVQAARKKGDVIVNEGTGDGYYRADPNDPEDVEAADRMIRSLTHRAYEILEIAQAMDESLHGRYPSKGDVSNG